MKIGAAWIKDNGLSIQLDGQVLKKMFSEVSPEKLNCYLVKNDLKTGNRPDYFLKTNSVSARWNSLLKEFENFKVKGKKQESDELTDANQVPF